MNSFTARYFDGRSSAARRVSCISGSGRSPEPDGLLVHDGAGEIHVPWSRLRVGDRLAGAPRVIYLQDAGELHSDDHAAVDALARRLGQGRLAAGVFRLESRLWVALVALIFSVAAAWLGLRHGLPWLAEVVVEGVPAGIEDAMGRQALTALDQWVLQPSALPAQRREALRHRLQAVCEQAGDCPSWRLEFRGGGELGANALALPGGTLVVTDEMVKLAHHDDELIAVAAHELGHIRQRHALRQALAGAGVVLLSQVLIGDLGGIADLASGLPALLLQTGYSRAMEREADAHALALMRRTCLPPRRFADIMTRLEAARPGADAGFKLFSTHPETRERIKVFRVQELGARGC